MVGRNFHHGTFKDLLQLGTFTPVGRNFNHGPQQTYNRQEPSTRQVVTSTTGLYRLIISRNFHHGWQELPPRALINLLQVRTFTTVGRNFHHGTFKDLLQVETFTTEVRNIDHGPLQTYYSQEHSPRQVETSTEGLNRHITCSNLYHGRQELPPRTLIYLLQVGTFTTVSLTFQHEH